MLEPVVHFLVHIRVLFSELAQGVLLDVLYASSLSIKLFLQLLGKFSLRLLTALLLSGNRIFHFVCFFLKELQDLPLLLDSSVSLCIQVFETDFNLLVDRQKLSVERLDAVLALLGKKLFKHLHSIVASLDLVVLVNLFCSVLFLELLSKILYLLFILLLIGP